MIRKKSSWKISDEGIIARLITRPIIDDFNRIASLELLFQLLPFSFFLFFLSLLIVNPFVITPMADKSHDR